MLLMNYAEHYEKLITRAKNRIPPSYFETHHIIPKCQGGDNNPSNLVKLTPEEHYLAHLLLCKMHPYDKKLLYAANVMTTGPDGKRNNNKSFGWLRRKMSELSKGPNNHMYGKKLTPQRKALSSHPGESNPFYGKQHSETTKKIISEKKKGSPGLVGELNGMFGKKHNAATKAKISENNPWKGSAGTGAHPNCGRKVSDEQKETLRKINIGRKFSEDQLHKWRRPKGPQTELTCPHCKKTGGASNMKRYHFNKCKEYNETVS
jgi:hypothetical protein